MPDGIGDYFDWFKGELMSFFSDADETKLFQTKTVAHLFGDSDEAFRLKADELFIGVSLGHK